MTLNRRQTALLQVVAKQFGWDDDLYRRILAKVAGVATSKDLDEAGFNAVMGFAAYVGFKPMMADGPNYGKREGFASSAQVDLIRALWIEAHHGVALDEDFLNGWLVKYWKVSSLWFLKKELAPRVISALKTLKSRAA